MLKFLVFLLFAAFVGSKLSFLGAANCNGNLPGANFPWGCGTFWWLALVIMGSLVLLLTTLRRAGRRTDDPAKRP